MLHYMVYTLPELSLFFGILHLCLLYLLSYDAAKVYARTARFWLLASLFCSILLYDKTFSPMFFENNAYTLLFKLLAGFFAYIMLGLSAMWFGAENRTGCRYYVLILCALIGSNLLLASSNLLATLFCYGLLIYINYRLLAISYEKLPSEAPTRYMGLSGVVVLLFAAGYGYLHYRLDGDVEYGVLREAFAENKDSFRLYMAAVAVVVPVMYSLGLAPFHITAEDKVGKGILPVSHYFALFLPVVLWGTLIKMDTALLAPYQNEFAPVYAGFALLSVIFGAMGANSRINLHRIFAYSSMYHFVIVLLLLSFFKLETDFAAFVYLFVCLLSLNGSYLVFYSLKSRGEYLASVTSLSGLAETRPYTTGALLVSLFSLIGLPPLAVFMGQFDCISILLRNGYFISLGIVLFFLLVLAKAYLDIMKTAYFEKKVKIFDTENRAVPFYTVFCISCIVLAAFNPGNLLQILKDMFYVVSL